MVRQGGGGAKVAAPRCARRRRHRRRLRGGCVSFGVLCFVPVIFSSRSLERCSRACGCIGHRRCVPLTRRLRGRCLLRGSWQLALSPLGSRSVGVALAVGVPLASVAPAQLFTFTSAWSKAEQTAGETRRELRVVARFRISRARSEFSACVCLAGGYLHPRNPQFQLRITGDAAVALDFALSKVRKSAPVVFEVPVSQVHACAALDSKGTRRRTV